jgi:tetratricopeptide (TPR) repeat protein
LDPAFFLSHLTIAQVEFFQGHEEVGLQEAEKALSASAAGSGLSRHGVADLRAEGAGLRDAALSDYLGVMSDDTALADMLDDRLRSLSAWRQVAGDLARLHDFSAASDILERLPSTNTGGSGTPAANSALPSSSPEFARIDVQLTAAKALYLAQSGDWRGALSALESIKSEVFNLRGAHAAEYFRTSMYPWLAEAYARVGRDADADAVLIQIPPDVYDGWRARGRIAALRHDYATAEKDFAEAVRQAPSIPRAFFDWGDMLAAKGDLAGAIAKYTEANRLGPHWADPLKAWGDVLARQGHPREALRKYKQALPHAPHWAELKALVDVGSRA